MESVEMNYGTLSNMDMSEEDKIDTILSRLDSLNEKVDALNDKFNRLEILEQKVDQIKDKLTELEVTVLKSASNRDSGKWELTF